MKKIIVLIILTIFIIVSPIYAENSSTAEIKVDHLAGFFEKVSERLGTYTKFKPKDKINYQKRLTEKRLAEIEYVIKSKEFDPIEDTTSRYMTYLNNLLVLAEQNKNDADKKALLEMADRHKRILNNIQKDFKYETGWWILIQHDINSLNSFSEKIKTF